MKQVNYVLYKKPGTGTFHEGFLIGERHFDILECRIEGEDSPVFYPVADKVFSQPNASPRIDCSIEGQPREILGTDEGFTYACEWEQAQESLERFRVASHRWLLNSIDYNPRTGLIGEASEEIYLAHKGKTYSPGDIEYRIDTVEVEPDPDLPGRLRAWATGHIERILL